LQKCIYTKYITKIVTSYAIAQKNLLIICPQLLDSKEVHSFRSRMGLESIGRTDRRIIRLSLTQTVVVDQTNTVALKQLRRHVLIQNQ